MRSKGRFTVKAPAWYEIDNVPSTDTMLDQTSVATLVGLSNDIITYTNFDWSSSTYRIDYEV